VSAPLDYDDLVTAATIGTDRGTLPLGPPAAGAPGHGALAGPAAAYGGVLDAADPAAALLDAAALLSSARQAGRRAAAADPPAPAAPDSAPELSAGAAAVLGFALRDRDPLLVADLLTAAAEAGFRAPPPVLPALLDAAVRDRALRPAVGAVLGERGRWLAARRPEWQRIADSGPLGLAELAGLTELAGLGELGRPDDQLALTLAENAVWLTGRPAERRAWLAAVRPRAPGAARMLLAAGWSRETGEDRAELLALLRAGLSAADEPFLEQALDDRAGPVRQSAARLLAGLPGSAFTRRAIGRGAAALRVERRGLRRELIVTLPGPADAAAARDGLAAPPPVSSVGPGAWRLTQLIAAVPLGEWTARLALAPRALVALPVADGYWADVQAGWRLAAVAQQDPDWAAALLESGYGDPPVPRPPAAWPGPAQLAAVLPPARRLDWATGLLAARGPSREIIAVLAGYPRAWPPAAADAVLAHLAAAAAGGRDPRGAAVLAPAAGRRLPAEGDRDYAADLRTLARSDAIEAGLADRLRHAAGVVARRRYFLRELH
jgi:Family of unknown function (DUF5691)